MDSFSINVDILVDFKVKSKHLIDTWYCINLEYMMVTFAVENHGSTGSHDKLYSGTVYPLNITIGGLRYYDSAQISWVLFPDYVQREYSDYLADKELLSENSTN